MTTIVLLSLEPWDDVWRRNQHLAHRLLRADHELRVLFVEPPADPIHALRRGRPARPGRGLRAIPGYGGRLVAFESTKWLPRAVDAHADRRLAARLAAALRRLRWHSDLFWINDPEWSLLADGVVPVIYDVTDDWTVADEGDARQSRVCAADARLVASSDAVVVCSPELARTKGAERPVELIPNAVDLAAYEIASERPADLPQRAALYAGTLHEHRLDVELVLATADAVAATGGTVALLGPDALPSHASASLRDHAAIRLLGSRPSAQLPAYLAHADTLIVPHVVTAFTDTLDPIKLYEYLAAGRPVVSTAVAGFRDHTAAAITVTSREGFAGVVARSLLQSPPSTRVADVPDWNDRAEAMRTVIEQVLARSSRPARPGE